MAEKRLSPDGRYFLLPEKEEVLGVEDLVGFEGRILPSPRLVKPANKLRGIYYASYAYLVLFHFVVLVLYFQSSSTSRVQHMTTSFSPATPFLHYELQKLNESSGDTSFSGPPTIENGEAWDNLLRPIFFNLTREELVSVGESPEDFVELPDGGYQAALDVHHDLHCLFQFRIFLYKEIYYPDMTETQLAKEIEHLDHCIDALRVSTMCAGDVGVFTFRMPGEKADNPEPRTKAERVCINWETFDMWARERMSPVDLQKDLPGKIFGLDLGVKHNVGSKN